MRDHACGNSNCGASSGILEELTFGRGKLSNSGYWQYPCLKCAAAFVASNPEMAAQYGVWPMTEAEARTAADLFLDVDDEFIWSEVLHDYDDGEAE